MQEISFDDTLENSQNPEVLLHGQSRVLSFDTNYYNGDSLSFFLRCTEDDTGKISVTKIDATNAISHDTSVTGEMVATLIQWGNGGKPVSWFYKPHLVSRRIALKEAVDGKLIVNNYGEGYVAIRLEKIFENWIPEYLRIQGTVKISWNNRIRIYTDQSRSAVMQLAKESLDNKYSTKEMDWVDFQNMMFNGKNSFIYITFPYGTEAGEVVFTYQNSKNKYFKKEEKIIINQRNEYLQNRDDIINKLMSICGCTDDPCRIESQREAEKIADAYLNVYVNKANCDDAYSMRVYVQMEYGHSYNGWMCYQWTYFVHESFNKLKFKVQRSGYSKTLDEFYDIDHNWITVFWGNASTQRETPAGIHFDAWIEKAPLGYTNDEHVNLLSTNGMGIRNFIATKFVKREDAFGIFIRRNGTVENVDEKNFFKQ